MIPKHEDIRSGLLNNLAFRKVAVLPVLEEKEEINLNYPDLSLTWRT